MNNNLQRLRRTTLAALLVCSAAAAQADITITLTSVSLKNALAEIEKVSDLHFFYKSDLPGLGRKISLTAKNEKETALLDRLFAGTNIVYTIEANNIVTLSLRPAEGKKSTPRKPIAITGIVRDNLGEPLIGASVKVAGSSVGTITDADGVYRLGGIDAGQRVEISYLGYNSYTFVPTASGSYNATLSEASSALSEVVVVGYGTQKKSNLTGAVSVIKSEDITGRPTGSTAIALQGADPSMNITMSSGGPNSGYSIDIRGVASINGGSPLILVDGCEMSLSRINANDIESVSVLKDASAAAIYGAKASSGVVLITTKNGRGGEAPRITVDAKAGWKSPTTSTDFISSGFWSVYINDLFMYEHGGIQYTTYTDADYAELWMRLGQSTESAERPWAVVQEDGSYKYYANFDWYHHYFKTTRPMQDYNVSVKGGTDRTDYYISGRLYAEDGMIRQNTDQLKEYALRSKINVKLNDWLKYGLNVSFFESKYHYPGSSDLQYTFKASALHSLAYIPSTNPDGTSVYANKYNYSGSVAVGDGLNALLNYGKHTSRETNREIMAKNDILITLTRDWTINADYAYLYRNYAAAYRRLPIPYSDVEGIVSYIDPATSTLSRDQYTQRNTNITQNSYNVYTTWQPSWGDNHFKLLLGTNGERYSTRSLKAERYDLLSTDLSSFNLATGEIPTLIEDIYRAHTIGFFGRVNYDYKGRYLVEASGRYDGSSRFSSKHRWGFFPSVSAGWRMSEERFWAGMSDWWTNAKLRLSAGSLGNQQVGYYDYIQTINTQLTNSSVSLDGVSYLPYATESSPVAGDLTWETVITYNLGLDLAFLNNRLAFTADAYIRDTKDMLTNGASLPAVYGASVPKSNCADLRTKGWELSLSWTDNISVAGSNMRYQISGGLGDYKAKITKFDNPTKLLSDYYVGMTLGEIWGYHVPGLFKSDEEAAAYDVDQSIVNSDIQVSGPSKGLHGGDMIYADLDGDKKISIGKNTADDPGDRRIIGNSLPRMNYNFRLGLDWKGIDVSIFFQGVGKRDWYPATEATTFWGPYSRPYQAFIEKGFMSNVWTEDNTNAYFPRYRGYEALGSTNSLGPTNDRYLQSLAYLRLKNATVGYTFPQFCKQISQLRLYFSGENLAYWSPFKKYCKSIDPETAASISTGVNYGFAKSFTFGVTATF